MNQYLTDLRTYATQMIARSTTLTPGKKRFLSVLAANNGETVCEEIVTMLEFERDKTQSMLQQAFTKDPNVESQFNGWFRSLRQRHQRDIETLDRAQETATIDN